MASPFVCSNDLLNIFGTGRGWSHRGVQPIDNNVHGCGNFTGLARRLPKVKTTCTFGLTHCFKYAFLGLHVRSCPVQHCSFMLQISFDLYTTVCNLSSWPTSQFDSRSCRRPQPIAVACQTFESFYLKNNNGKKLTWRFDCGSADVQLRFSANCTRTLSVTPIMVCFGVRPFFFIFLVLFLSSVFHSFC
jgi:hypothetical protein